MENDKPLILESGLILDCLDFDILVIDKDFKILYANKAIKGKLNLTEKNGIVGKYCYEATHHLDHPCEPPHDPCPIMNVMKTGKPSIETHTHITKENKKFLVNVTAAKISEISEDDVFLHIALPLQEKNREKDLKKAMGKTLSTLKVVNEYHKLLIEKEKNIDKLEKTKKKLELKIEELETFNKITVGRELKMIDLKEKIKELEDKIKNN